MTTHPNVELTRRGYEAFAKGDVQALRELMDDDVTWHVSDGGPLSGSYHGQNDVLGFLVRLAQETGGTFRLDVHAYWRTTSTLSPLARFPPPAAPNR